MYQVLDALLLRASVHPGHVHVPAAPDLTGDVSPTLVRDWLAAVWARTSLADAITVASPTLADQVERIRTGRCDDPRQLRRAVMPVTRYALRATGRATPFGLFAGIAPVGFGAEPAVRWGDAHRTVIRADGAWLDDVVTRLEGCPELLRRLPVVVNDLTDVRGDRLTLAAQRSGAHEDRRDGAAPTLVDVSVRRTAAIDAITAHARSPVRVSDLLDTLRRAFPNGSLSAAEAAIARLVRLRFLLTALRPPMTVTDGLTHVVAQLEALDAQAIAELTGTVRALRAIAGRLSSTQADAATGWDHTKRRALTMQMKALCADAGQLVTVDLRIDAAVTVPDTLLQHARDAAAVLTRLTPYPRGAAAWRDYHAAFLERYGLGAVVPLQDVVNPDIGLGLPATYRGSDRTIAAEPLGERDRMLLRLAHNATLAGEDELALDDPIVDDLAGPDDLSTPAPPHLELCLQVHADDLSALRQDRYGLLVTGAARAAGATAGRFLHLLDSTDIVRFRHAYTTVATSRAGALPVQVSCPPAQPSSDHLACAPPMLPTVLAAGEYVDTGPTMRVQDLAVGGDVDGLYLVSLPDRRLVEPTVLNAVEFRNFSHPLARFLCELPRARSAVYMPFTWGAAAALTVLPRVRTGRTVLAPARWNLHAGELPPAGAPWRHWRDALAAWRDRFRLPDRVHLVHADNLLPLNLAENVHRALLRAHLDRHGHARLDQAPHPNAFGWLHGHAHEITIPLTASTTAAPAPPTAGVRVVDHAREELPGTGTCLYAKLYASADGTVELAHQVPELINDWADAVVWWYLPYRDPDPHLRLRIRLPHAGAYGPAAARLGTWAARLRERRLLGRLQLDTYHPETGRYGHGDAMTAAELVFAADSAAALAERQAATSAAVPLDAVATASIVDLVMAFTGNTATAMAWLITRVPTKPAPIGRGLRSATMQLAEPTTDRAALRAIEPTGTVLRTWQQRGTALAAYRAELGSQRDPLSVLPALLHLHSIRRHGVDPDRERLNLQLARAAALRWRALHTASTP